MNTTTHTIMVVEDEDLLLRAITKKLEIQGMKTISCTRAEQALDYLNSMDELPDAIWLDYYLKGDINGLDFLRELKANESWKDLPVIVVSNTASDEKVKNMLALGANKYMLKAEHRLDEIVDSMKTFISDDDES